MNVGYYEVVFDLATDAWLDHVGLTAEHRTEHDVTTFTLESHSCFLREVREGEPLRFTTLLLGFDEKRIHYFHEMYHADRGYVAATCELMSLHVSQSTRRAAAMEPGIENRLATLLAGHGSAPRSPQIGRKIGLRKRPKPA